MCVRGWPGLGLAGSCSRCLFAGRRRFCRRRPFFFREVSRVFSGLSSAWVVASGRSVVGRAVCAWCAGRRWRLASSSCVRLGACPVGRALLGSWSPVVRCCLSGRRVGWRRRLWLGGLCSVVGRAFCGGWLGWAVRFGGVVGRLGCLRWWRLVGRLAGLGGVVAFALAAWRSGFAGVGRVGLSWLSWPAASLLASSAFLPLGGVSCLLSLLRLFPFVGFAGPRSGPASSASSLVSSLVGSVLASGRGVASGCASGVDSLAVSAALAAAAGPRLSVFCAFGPSGLGALGRSSAPPSSLVPVVASGGSVAWWAGGAPRPGGPVPRPVSRLVGRSLAFVRALALAGPGSGLVVLVSGPPPRAFARSSSGAWPVWPSCGSGSWGSAAAASLAPSARRSLSRRLVRFLARGVAPAARSVWLLVARRRRRSLVRRLALVRLIFSVRFRAARVRRPFSFQEVLMNTVARAAWLLPSPAIRHQFGARNIPVPRAYTRLAPLP